MARTRSQARADRDFVDSDSDLSDTSGDDEFPIFENLTRSDLVKSEGSRITWRYATKTKLVLHAIKYRYSSKSMPSLPVAVDLMQILEVPVHEGAIVAKKCVEKVLTLVNNIVSAKGTGGLIEEQCVGRLGRSSLYTVRFHGALWTIAKKPEAFDYRYMLTGSWVSQKKADFDARKVAGVEDWIVIADGKLPDDQMGTKKVYISKIANAVVNGTKLTLPAELPRPLIDSVQIPAGPEHTTHQPGADAGFQAEPAAGTSHPRPAVYDQYWYNLWYHNQYYLPYMVELLERGTPINAKVWKRIFPTYPTVEYVEDFDYVKWAAELPQKAA